MKKLWKIMVTDSNYSFFNYLNNEGNEDNRTEIISFDKIIRWCNETNLYMKVSLI